MFKVLLALLDNYGVHYERIAEDEIAIDCPANLFKGSFDALSCLTMDEIINSPNVVGLSDEAIIRIQEDNGCLNWLIVDSEI